MNSRTRRIGNDFFKKSQSKIFQGIIQFMKLIICRNFKETKERLDGIISVNFNEDYEGTHFIHDRDIMHSRFSMQGRNFNFAIQTFQVCQKVGLDLLVSFQWVNEFQRYIASQFTTGDSSFHFYHLNNSIWQDSAQPETEHCSILARAF